MVMTKRKAYERLTLIALNATLEGRMATSSGEAFSVTSDETEIIPEEFDDGYDFGTIVF